MINRKMDPELDRDVEDFNLTVSSPDLNRPLKFGVSTRKCWSLFKGEVRDCHRRKVGKSGAGLWF